MAARRDNRFRSRPGRGRERARGKGEVDAIAAALTMQIIICVLVLLAAQISKTVNEPGFYNIKREYISLVDAGQNISIADYFSHLSDMVSGFFASVEENVQQWAVRTHLPMPQTALQAEAMGMGGGSSPPLKLPATGDGMLPAPEGSTLAPFALSSRLRPPLTGVITSQFAFRVHPISGNMDFHNGIDIAAPYGQAILAALPGQVEQVGESGTYGKYVILRHAHNLKTFYAHCSQIFVREGMWVNQGERIARVGATGVATGPHLHFSIIVDGLYADPFHALGRYIRQAER